MGRLWSHLFCIMSFPPFSKKNRLYIDEYDTFFETEGYEFEHIQVNEGMRPEISVCPGSV